MISISHIAVLGIDGRGYKLEQGDLNVLYERSVLHAEHGKIKKVFILRIDGD
jgi:hypothetical protein